MPTRPAVWPVIVLVTWTEPNRGVIGLFTLTCTPAGSLGIVNVTLLPVTVPADAVIKGGSQPKSGVVGGRCASVSVTVQVAPTGIDGWSNVAPSARVNVTDAGRPAVVGERERAPPLYPPSLPSPETVLVTLNARRQLVDRVGHDRCRRHGGRVDHDGPGRVDRRVQPHPRRVAGHRRCGQRGRVLDDRAARAEEEVADCCRGAAGDQLDRAGDGRVVAVLAAVVHRELPGRVDHRAADDRGLGDGQLPADAHDGVRHRHPDHLARRRDRHVLRRRRRPPGERVVDQAAARRRLGDRARGADLDVRGDARSADADVERVRGAGTGDVDVEQRAAADALGLTGDRLGDADPAEDRPRWGWSPSRDTVPPATMIATGLGAQVAVPHVYPAASKAGSGGSSCTAHAAPAGRPLTVWLPPEASVHRAGEAGAAVVADGEVGSGPADVAGAADHLGDRQRTELADEVVGHRGRRRGAVADGERRRRDRRRRPTRSSGRRSRRAASSASRSTCNSSRWGSAPPATRPAPG